MSKSAITTHLVAEGPRVWRRGRRSDATFFTRPHEITHAATTEIGMIRMLADIRTQMPAAAAFGIIGAFSMDGVVLPDGNRTDDEQLCQSFCVKAIRCCTHADLGLKAGADHLVAAPTLVLRLAPDRLDLLHGSVRHAERVTQALGIDHHFEGIFDIVAADFVPKPETQTYEKFLALHDVDPSRAAMFEDLAKNLVAPAALGMKTVLVLPKAVDPFRETHEQTAPDAPYIHYRTTDLAGFLEQIETVRGVRSAPPLPKG
jgi:beta-phosphoglucomutase-like phosphatase (HAD superfamily)